MGCRLAPFAVLLATISPLSAQARPATSLTAAVVGSWHFDPARSDSVPSNPMTLLGGGGERGPGAAAGATSALGGAPTGGVGGGVGGGGGGRRGGGGGGGGGVGGGGVSGASGTAPQGLGPRSGGRMNDPKLRSLIGEARPAPVLVITVHELDITIADDQGHITPWRADGRKHLEAQMEGGVIEFEAKWKGKTLVVERGIPEGTTLRREFKPSDDGSTLELKTVLESAGRKVERKFIYTRNPAKEPRMDDS